MSVPFASCSGTNVSPPATHHYRGDPELMSSRQILAARGAIVSVFALAAGLSGTTGASAAFPQQLPYMCFNTAHTFHQTFGPDSFFLKETQQGSTSFREGGPRSKPTVTLPLYQGV